MEIKMAISHYMSNTAFTGILKIPRKLITSKTHATSFFNVCGRKKKGTTFFGPLLKQL